tara:strand:- start:45 stop:566 length:522 start_codon:yes stop_codon:yes gene_type:complete
MKHIREKLRMCEYDYPFADSLNPKLHKIICDLPDVQNRRTSLQSKMTSWNTEVREFKIIIDLVSQLLHRDFLKFESEKVKCSEVWGALYGKEDHATIHNHEPSYFSFVYYVNVPKNSAPLVFVNSGYKVKPYSGKLIIFDSKLYHKVPKNRSENRSLIAGNFVYENSSGVYGL